MVVYGLIYDKKIEKCLKNGGDMEAFNVEWLMSGVNGFNVG